MSQVNTQSSIPFYFEEDENHQVDGSKFDLINFFPPKSLQKPFEPLHSSPLESSVCQPEDCVNEHQLVALELSLKRPAPGEEEERLTGKEFKRRSNSKPLIQVESEPALIDSKTGFIPGCTSSLGKEVSTSSQARSTSGCRVAPVSVPMCVLVSNSAVAPAVVPVCASLPVDAVVPMAVPVFASISVTAVDPLSVPLAVHLCTSVCDSTFAIRKESSGHGQNRQGSESSPYKGVSLYKKNKNKDRWEAKLCFRKENYYLGGFSSPELADGAYDRAAIYSGKPELNFPEENYAAEIHKLRMISFDDMIQMLRQQSARGDLHPTYPQ